MSADIRDAEEILQVAFEHIRLAYEKLMPGFTLVVTESHRPIERQTALYAQGRTAPGPIVTNIDGDKVKGKHNYMPARAIDVAVKRLNDGKIIWDQFFYKPLLGLAAAASTDLRRKITSGGSWKSIVDWPHLEI